MYKGVGSLKTLILNGSPRKQGDTARSVQYLKERLEGEIIEICSYEAKVSPCIDCRACQIEPRCILQDDMQRVYTEIESCDAIILASPIYFSEITGSLLSMMSRLQRYFCAEKFLKKPTFIPPKRGGIILFGGGTGTFLRAEATAKLLLKHLNVTERYPSVIYQDTDHSSPWLDKEFLHRMQCLVNFLKP